MPGQSPEDLARGNLAREDLTREDLDQFSEQAFRSLEVLARALHVKDARLEPALQAIVSAAVQTVSPAQDAGLILVLRGELVPQATTGRPPQLLDQLQRKLKDGPCISAAEEQTLIRIEDMRREDRWPEVAARRPRPGGAQHAVRAAVGPRAAAGRAQPLRTAGRGL